MENSAVIHNVNARTRFSPPSEATPVWLLPVVVALGALSLVAVLGLRSTQRGIDREAEWQVPSDLESPSGLRPSLTLTQLGTSPSPPKNS